ncbi:MAG: hypothetical protein AAGB13_15660 [Cyanobacteria bacterium P01_F01_bin.33]
MSIGGQRPHPLIVINAANYYRRNFHVRKIIVASATLISLNAVSTIAQETGIIDQQGLGGAAYIDQTRQSDSSSIAHIEQLPTSTGDVAAILQRGNVPMTAHIHQDGSDGKPAGNVAGIVQQVAEIGVTTNADINQSGGEHTAGIYQRNTGNTADVDQRGDNQEAMVYQGSFGHDDFTDLDSGTLPNTTLTTAAAADLESSLLSYSLPMYAPTITLPVADSTNSTAMVDQEGESNRALILQSGNNNYGSIDQNGMDDIAIIQQENDDNSATIEQSDPSITSVAVISQSGGENVAKVEQ